LEPPNCFISFALAALNSASVFGVFVIPAALYWSVR
jgi:hypothetical protein